MKLIIVHISDINFFPPIISILNILEKNNIETVYIGTKTNYVFEEYKNIRSYILPIEYERKRNYIKKFLDLLWLRKEIWKTIKKEYTSKDIIWSTSWQSIIHIGMKIINYNYIFQLLEYVDELRYVKFLPFKLNSNKIGKYALEFVVPEYNRAHIFKGMWQLDYLPKVLPNKPFLEKNIKKNSYINDNIARETINVLKKRKIILYQGILMENNERNLEEFIKAIDDLGDNYALVILTNGKNKYNYLKSKNIFFIPFVSPPLHLEITSHAYIGILSYFPQFPNILNVLYCAPNKTFEYSMFGIPMISNDNPALNNIFNTYKCGLCVKDYTKSQICESIKKIEKKYQYYSDGSREYYNSIDVEKELLAIIDDAKHKIDIR